MRRVHAESALRDGPNCARDYRQEKKETDVSEPKKTNLEPSTNQIHDGIEHESTGGKALINPADTVLLLLDHQAGLFQTVKDIEIAQLRANTTMLAKLATLMKLPLITTASVPDGPNGPLMPEILEFAPHAVYVPRKGEVNAWDNALFVKTVRDI